MTGTDIKHAIALLKEEAIVAVPTETVYGLAGNAFSEKAIAKIFAAKNRPSFDPLIVHTHRIDSIYDFVKEIPEKALKLARAFMPGPLSLLLPKKDIIPDIVTAGSPIVAIRIPAHPLTQELLSKLDFPLAAPSANPFGYISPTTAQHVAQQLGERIPYILDGGACKVGLESTIVGFKNDRAIIFRKGGIPVEAIEDCIGKVEVMLHSSSNPQAPGMLKSHYAPSIPFIIGSQSSLFEKYADKKIGIISFQDRFPGIPEERQIILSPTGNFTEAARNLFSGMRRLDAMQLDVIIAELVPEKDLGRAINDRLRRAGAVAIE